MKIRIQHLFGIITSVFCLCNINVATATTCPAGFFCTAGGTYNGIIEPYQMGPADLVTANWGGWTDEGLCSQCISTCIYCMEDYDEIWVSNWFGFYLVKNGEVSSHSASTSLAQGAFPCPGTYPTSAPGASSVFQCYKVISNGQKKYYTAPVTNTPNGSSGGTCDLDNLRRIANNLQSALNQANKAAQDLQKELSKVTAPANAMPGDKSSNPDLNAMKAMISAGMPKTTVKQANKAKK